MAHMSRKTTWHERRRHEEGTTEVTWLVAVGLWDFGCHVPRDSEHLVARHARKQTQHILPLAASSPGLTHLSGDHAAIHELLAIPVVVGVLQPGRKEI